MSLLSGLRCIPKGLSKLDHTNLKTFFPGLSELPGSSSLSELPETRHVSQVETWLLRGVNLSTPTKHLACSPPQSYPSRAKVPQALAPQALAPQAMV